MKKILIAIDDSAMAEKVTEAGLQLAQQLNAEMALLSVVDTSFPYIVSDGATVAEMTELTKTDFKKKHKMLIKDRNIWSFVEEGNPNKIILNIAKEWNADLIVMGTHGRTGVSHFLLGSVAEKVLRHSTKPVLVIPTNSL